MTRAVTAFRLIGFSYNVYRVGAPLGLTAVQLDKLNPVVLEQRKHSKAMREDATLDATAKQEKMKLIKSLSEKTGFHEATRRKHEQGYYGSRNANAGAEKKK